LGEEGDIDYRKVESPKNIFIIGGGPGGLEAARAAAIKGHKVSLYEKRDFLGGQFRSASFPPCKGELATYTAWAINELEKLNVGIHLSTEVTKEMIIEKNPDVIIFAAGGIPLVPPIKGIDKPHVLNAEEVLLGHVPTGNRIVIAGGGEVGSETAGHLGMQQKAVVIVEMLPELCKDLDGVNKFCLMKILDEYQVKSYTDTKVIEILDDGVVVENKNGQHTIPADTVVLALGYKPNSRFVEELKALNRTVKMVGGAVKTSNALTAIYEGFHAGISIQ
jgi:NADPH-dependent 2,4-dienoyl-CoA reductase/sulfur reductase-like enzyme